MNTDRLKYWLHSIFLPNSLRTMEWRMLFLLNADRRIHHLKALTMQSDLRVVARNHSFHMAEEDFFSHTDKANRSPGDRIKGAGITDVVFGENLAKMRGFEHVTEQAEDALMKSPGHRANILNGDFNCVGVGVIQAKDQTYYFTQNFARRFLRLNFRKLYVKAERELYLTANILEAFEQIAVQEKYEKPFEFTYKVDGKKVMITLKLQERGRYELDVFVKPKNENKYYLSNALNLRAYRTWFDRFFI